MKIYIQRLVRSVPALAVACLIAACGGGTASIGGTVTGLTPGTSLTLQDNNGSNVTVSADQGFSFPAGLASGASYDVSVLTQPLGQTCTVGNGIGQIDVNGDDVTNVTVTCSLTSSVGVTVFGLLAGNSVTLSENGQSLPIAVSGAFAFPGILPAGTAFTVSVVTQPAQQTCTVLNGAGVVSATAMANVSVSCN